MSARALPLLTSALFVSSLSYAASDVNLAGEIDPEHCQLVKEERCSTQKSDGVSVCEKRLKEEADELNANTLVLGEIEQTVQRKPSLNGVKTVTITSVNAAIYRCPVASDAPQSREYHPAPVERPMEKSVEERLIQLNGLKEKGLISDEEYQSKRAEILEEL